MSTGIIAIVLLLVLAGCTEVRTVVCPRPKPRTVNEAVAELRDAARVRNLRWHIEDDGHGSSCAFAAQADGTDWIYCKGNAIDAAEALTDALNSGDEPYSRPMKILASSDNDAGAKP